MFVRIQNLAFSHYCLHHSAEKLSFPVLPTKWELKWRNLLHADPSGRSRTEIVGSNTAGGMDVYLLTLLCVVRSLRRAGPSSRGVLPSVVCVSVIAELQQRGGLGSQGLSNYGGKNYFIRLRLSKQSALLPGGLRSSFSLNQETDPLRFRLSVYKAWSHESGKGNVKK
jgi:hypothetical protein